MISRTSKAISGSLTSLIQYGLIMILQFLLVPVIISFSNDETLGLYSYLLQIIGWAALSDMGFGVAAGRYLAQSNDLNDNHQRFKLVFKNSRTFYLVSNIIFSIIILLIAYNLEFLIDDLDINLLSDAKTGLYFFSIWGLVRTPLLLYGEALVATQFMTKNNIAFAQGSVARLLCSVVLVYLGFGILGLIFGYILGEFSTFLFQKRTYNKLFPDDNFGWGISDRKLFNEIFLFGLTYMLVSISSKISSGSDAIIVGSIFGASAAAVLYVSTMPGALIYQFIWKIVDNSSPAFNELYYKNLKDKIKINYLKIVRYSSILVFGLIIGLILFNYDFVKYWSGESTYAGEIFNLLFAIFCFTQVFLHINYVLMIVSGDIKKVSFLTVFFSIVKLIFCFLFLEKIGLYGLVISNLIADIPLIIYSQLKINKLLRLNYYNNIYIYIIFPVKSNILLIIFSIIIYQFGLFDSVINLFLNITFFIIIFLLNTYYISLNSNDKLILKNFFNSIFNKLKI